MDATTRAPWWAGILMALLQIAKLKYPDLAEYITALMVGLASHWGFSLLTQARRTGETNEVIAEQAANGSGKTNGSQR